MPMKTLHLAALSAAALATPALASEVQYRTPADTAAARAQGEIGTNVLVDPAFRVMALRRDKPGQAEVHHLETDIFLVVDGRATMVVGGEVIDGKDTAPGEVRGSGIKGGKDYALEPGVVMTVPVDTPHWIRETTPGFRYTVVKVKAR